MGDRRSQLRKPGAAARTAAPATKRAAQPGAAARLQQRIGLQGTQALLARAAIQRSAASPGVAAAAGGMRVSSPSDPAEREAESVAKQVMRSPAAPDVGAQHEAGVARKAEAGAQAPASPPAGHAATGGSGTPLPAKVRAFMEPRFKASFGHVRIHTDQAAARKSTQLQARAFTVGTHIFFGKGQFQPDTSEGLELIAHELTHTLQQGGAVQRRAAPDVRSAEPEHVQRDALPSTLEKAAKVADEVPGFSLLTQVLGVNPLTNKPVERSAEGVISGIMKLIGEAEVWVAIQTAKATDPAWAWIQGATQELKQRLVSISKTLADPNTGFFAAAEIIVKAFLNLAGDFKRWAAAAVWELLKIVFEAVSPGITPFLKQAGDALKLILKHPIEFVKNLAAAAKEGFINFGTNFASHLKEKLLEWLTGAMPGVYVPKAFSLREILKFAFDVLHIGWQFIRGKLVRKVGESAVAGMEHSHDLVKSMMKDGPAGASEKIKEHVGDVTQTVVGGITSFVIEMVVKTAIPKLISLFVPGAGVVTAIVSIYDMVMVFVQKLATITQLVKDFLGSLAAIAQGNVKAAAGKVESTLKGVLAIAIAFFARFVGAGKIPDKVMALLDKIRVPIEKAINAVVEWIAAGAKKLGKKVVQAGVPADPHERLRVGMAAALKVVNQFKGKRVGKLVLMPLLTAVRVRYGFSVLEVLPIGRIWGVHGKINPDATQSSDNVVVELDPNEVRYTQATITYQSKGKPYNLDQMVEAAKRGDELPQINTVQMATGELISMDNRRVYAGRQAAKEKKGYRLKGIVWKYDQLLPNGKLRSNFTLREGEVEKLQKMGKRIGKNPPSTWGEAVHLRILRQEIFEGGEGFSEKYPNGSPFDPKVVGRPDSH